MTIIGREAEIREVEAILDGTATGGPGGAVVEGPAGIGKSTIWEAGVEVAQARGWLVLTARAVASESALTLSVLGDLLGPIDEREIAELPAPQRRAIDAALLRTDGDDAGRRPLEGRVLGTAVRSLIERLASRRPVLLAIDDVQWADAASAAAVSFAVRRLDAVPVAVLLARRTPLPLPLDLDEALPGRRWRSIAVGPMSLGALHEVLGSRGRPPSRATLVRIHQVSAGNPLFALEIARVLEATGAPAAGEPLPVPGDIRDLIGDRLAAEAPRTRRVLLDLAVLGPADIGRLGEVEGRDIATDLAPALAHGLARRDGAGVSFAHPLYAAAAIATAPAEERRAAHARIAATATGLEEAARHRALATEGPDGGVADALEAAAHSARGRGAPLAAAELLRLAVERTPAASTDAAARRRIALAEELKRAGDIPAAVDELEAVIVGDDRLARARARLVLAAIRFETDASTSAAVAIARAALADASGNVELEAHAYAVLAAVDWDDLGAHGGYVAEAEARLARIVDPDPAVEGLVVTVRCGLDVAQGRGLDPALVARGLELERIAPAAAIADRFSGSMGTWLKRIDRFDEARSWLEQARQAAVDEGDEGSLPYALGHLPELELWTGHWDRAEALAHEHLALAEATGLESQRVQALYNLALVHAHQGRVEEARAEIAAALQIAERDGDQWMVSGILPLRGLLELSLGAPAAAVEPLDRAHAIRARLGGIVVWRPAPDLVEALVGAGHLERAAEIQAETEERTAGLDQSAVRAAGARSGAILLAARGHLEDARDVLTTLLDSGGPPIAFDRGRAWIALGQVRRRLRERGAARDAFEEARVTFAGLGARLWEERAITELGRTGLRRGAGLELTENERRVAQLAASGMTNREVAAALFMSPKTVDANLGRAYLKLGIRSRAELGAVLGRGAGAAPAQAAAQT